MKHTALVASAVIASLLPAQIASAQSCIQPEDLSDAMVFAVPIAYSAFAEKCGPSLAKDGFVHTQGDAFVAPYAALEEESWPGAYSFFKVFATKGNGKKNDMAEMFDGIDPQLLRPLFSIFIKAELSKLIKTKDCSKVERLIEPLAPLPPQNMGNLIATIVDIVPNKREPQICAADDQ